MRSLRKRISCGSSLMWSGSFLGEMLLLWLLLPREERPWSPVLVRSYVCEGRQKARAVYNARYNKPEAGCSVSMAVLCMCVCEIRWKLIVEA